MKTVTSLFILFTCTLFMPVPSRAQDTQRFPVKPVRIIVGFAAGGPNDTQARLVGQKIAESMGQPVIVDNRPGADGVIGADLVAKSPPDGYTLMLVSAGHVINPNFTRNIPYKPVDDFLPLVQITRSPFVLVVHPAVPAQTVGELIQVAKMRVGGLNFGSAGNGSSLQLAMELFNNTAGIKMVHVPYKGGAPATTDLIAGQVQVMINNIVSTLPPARAGKLRALAVTTAKRSAAAPDLPTVAESLPGFEVDAWYGFLAPRGVPAAVTAKLNGEINKAITLPDVRQLLLTFGLEPVGGTPEQFRSLLSAEYVKWAKVISDAGIRAE